LILAVLLLVNLVSAALLAILPALALSRGLGHQLAIHQAADGVDAWLVIDALTAPITDGILGQAGHTSELTSGLRQGLLVGVLTAALLPLLAWLPATFLSGGVLLTYADAHRSPNSAGGPSQRWRRFLWGCWHWFGPFLALGTAQMIAGAVVFGLGLAVAIGAALAGSAWITWGIALVAMLLAVLWIALVELTRAVAVTEGTRHVIRAFAKALRTLQRHPRPVAMMYGLAFLLLGLVHAVFHWGVLRYIPLNWWALLLPLQQLFVLTRLSARLARVAGGVQLVLEAR
jgi:hypothetical protein